MFLGVPAAGRCARWRDSSPGHTFPQTLQNIIFAERAALGALKQAPGNPRKPQNALESFQKPPGSLQAIILVLPTIVLVDPAPPGSLLTNIFGDPAPPGGYQTNNLVNPTAPRTSYFPTARQKTDFEQLRCPLYAFKNVAFVDPAPPGAPITQISSIRRSCSLLKHSFCRPRALEPSRLQSSLIR